MTSARSRLAGRLDAIDRPTWLVLGLSLALFVAFSLYTSALYASYWSTGADLGAYTHMFATTLSRKGWLLQGKYIAGHPGGSYWGGHFSLTVLVFLPIYALVPSPVTLLVTKSFVLAASIPVFWVLARDHIDSDRLAGFLTLSYALNPFLWSAWLFDFQEQILVPIGMFAAYYAYTRRRYGLFLLGLAFVLLTNEFMAIVVGGALVGFVLAALRGGRLRSELTVLLPAIALTGAIYIGGGLVISQFSIASGLSPYAVAGPLRSVVSGSRIGVVALLETVLTKPSLLETTLFDAITTKVVYLALFLLPVGFLALADEISLFSLAPYVAFAWLIGTPNYYAFNAHYPLYLLPFVYIGALRVLRRIDTPYETLEDIAAGGGPASTRVRTALSVVFAVLLVTNLVVGVGLARQANAVPNPDTQQTRELSAAIDMIPPNASMLTQNTIYPHVAARENATFFPSGNIVAPYLNQYGVPDVEYVLFDTNLETRSVDWSKPVRDAYVSRIGEGYGVYARQDGIWILKRGYNGSPKGITESYGAITRRYAPDDFSTGTGNREGGQIVSNDTQSGFVWFGPYATLTPGSYIATFRLNVTGRNAAPAVELQVVGGGNHSVVASKQVGPTDGTRTVTVEFRLNESTTGVEFRGERVGAGRVAFDGVTVASKNATTGG